MANPELSISYMVKLPALIANFGIHSDWSVMFMTWSVLVLVRLHVCMWQSGHGECIVYRWTIDFVIFMFFWVHAGVTWAATSTVHRIFVSLAPGIKNGSVNLGANMFCIHRGDCVAAISLQNRNWTEKNYQTLANFSLNYIPVFRRLSAGTVRDCTRRAKKTISVFESTWMLAVNCCAQLIRLATCDFFMSKFELPLFTGSGMASGGRIGVGWSPCLARPL